MYFQSFDIPHILLSVVFLLITLWVVFLRYRKSLNFREWSTNYTKNRTGTLVRLTSLVLSILLLATSILGPSGLIIQGASENISGIDCVWLLDVSASMDVPDVSDGGTNITRLERAKSIIENYMVTHPENRYGLVIFAGASRLVSPLTSEHSSLLSFLASIDSKSIREGGSDFLKALNLSIERFDTKEHTPHTIVLLSDGGDPEDAPDTPSVRSLFQGKNIKLTTIGIGDAKPSPIPTGKNPFGDTIYKRFQWEIVLSGLNAKNMDTLAKVGHGHYLGASYAEQELRDSLSDISRQTFANSDQNADDITVRVLIALSFVFFLIFILFPSSRLKKWNAS